jgi:hypothetical protein
MTRSLVDRVVNAVLYEGYLLYPYRPSSVKNKQRWTFGGLYPPAYSEAQGGFEPSAMQTECVVVGENATLNVHVRFLHLQERTREGASVAWQEAIEREVVAAVVTVGELAQPRAFAFDFPASREDSNGTIRERQSIGGVVEFSARPVGGAFVLTVRVSNRTPLANAAELSRDAASLHALVSTHTILTVSGGEFVSMIDPPAELKDAVAGCQNIGCWPVLVSETQSRDTMLASPIILYDYPEVAAESPGDLFDATEIDEILTLRILTMTDAEKREMVETDSRAKELLERTEALTGDDLMRLHGVIRRPRENRS